MLDKLLKLSKILRSDKGCPWDKERVLADFPPMLIGESEEIKEAIEKKDWNNLKEEIGDVLFNLCLLITIAEEQKLFKAKDLIDHCSDKIIARHTWVFGSDKARTAEEALELWKKNKEKPRITRRARMTRN